MPLMMEPSYMLILIVGAIITMGAQFKVKSAFAKWSKVPNERGLSGVETARIIIQNRGLENIQMKRVPGELTDFYDPRDKSINLSDSSTGGPSVAAMAVVAHELGHAQQDKAHYGPMRFRAALVPAANIGSQLGVWLVIIGLGFGVVTRETSTWSMWMAWLGIFLFSAAVLFQLVTLPVEFDASKRAKRDLAELGLASPTEQEGVNEVLNAAALTYVAAAATAIMTLLYLFSRVEGRRR
jgi:Zn-dependent membrane protease YugP